jgi:DNA-binding NarL/FixJ family response regulator
MSARIYLSNRVAPPELDARDRAIVARRRKARREFYAKMRRLWQRVRERSREPIFRDLPLQLWRTARLLALGHTVASIAAKIGVKPVTASLYRLRVLRRMRCPSQTLLARRAIRDGFVSVDERDDAKGKDGIQRSGPLTRART